jgi:hypothetical protein
MVDELDEAIDGNRKLAAELVKPILAKLAMPAAPTAKRNRHKDQFIIVPMAWKDRLKDAVHASTFKLAHHLLYEDWKTEGAPIRLSNTALAKAGITRWAKWRALGELEKLGLVVVERKAGRSPVAKVVRNA